MDFANFNLVRRALYSASLLVVGNWSRTAYWITSFSSDSRTTPTPLASLLDDPSTFIVYQASSSLFSTPKVNSAIKLANAWALMAVWGRHLTSNFPNSIAHKTNHPAASSLFIAFFIGWSISIIIECAWKYGRNFCDSMIRVKTIFLMLRYHASTPLKAWLV